MIAGVLALLSSYAIAFMLVVAKILKADTALKYIKYSLFSISGAWLILSLLT